MPSNFVTSYTEGDEIFSIHSRQYASPVNNLEEGIPYYGLDTSASTTTYTVTLAPAPASYTTGMFINFIPNNTNAGVATINANAIGSNIIKKGTHDLQAGDLTAGHVHFLLYDGVHFQLLGKPSTVRVIDEVPAGAVDGVNVTFTLANTPIALSVRVHLNGLKQTLTTHYTISGATITMSSAPTTGDSLTCDSEYV